MDEKENFDVLYEKFIILTHQYEMTLKQNEEIIYKYEN